MYKNALILTFASLAFAGCANRSGRLAVTAPIPGSALSSQTSQDATEPSAVLASTRATKVAAASTASFVEENPSASQLDDAGVVEAYVLDLQAENAANEESVTQIGEQYFSQGYTLADVEALALANNPTLSAAQALVSKSSGLRYQVGRLPNPLLGYFGQQIANRNTDQHGIFVEQDFVRGNKLELNQEVLGHTQRAQAASLHAQRYRILTDVRVRFFEALAAQQKLAATQDFARVAREGVEVAQDLEDAEEGSLVATLQAKTLLSEVVLSQEQAEVALSGAWNDLAALAGINTEAPENLTADMTVPDVQTDWDMTYAEIVAQSPELAAAQATVCEKSALYRRQQAQPIPNVTAQLGAGYDDATDHGMINAQLSAPIPVWNKNCGNIKAAYADYVRATKEVQRIEQSIKSRLARVSAEFESALRAVRKYEEEIIPQATQSLELSEEAYRVGELGFLQVLIVRRNFFESTLRLIDAKVSLAQAAAKVDGLLLTGALDSPRDYTSGDSIRGSALGGR